MSEITLNKKRLTELNRLAVETMNTGDFEGLLGIVQELTKLGSHHAVSFVISGILIDTGSILGIIELVEDGVELINQCFEKLVNDERFASQACYNLANGYYVLFNLKIMQKSQTAFFKKTDLDKAKKFFGKALNFDLQNSKFKSEIWVNLGNCFDTLGRGLDALDCYEEALKLNPDHGMALGNKGVAMCYYAQASGEHQGTFLKEAHDLLSRALDSEVPPETINGFSFYLKNIEKMFPNSEILENSTRFPGYKIKARSKFEKYLQEFCLKNKLYLNVCNFCQKCNASIGDNIVIKKMIIKEDKDNVAESFRDNPYFHFSTYLNQIKQDYVTARFLLILSRYRNLNLDFVDRNVRIINTFDYPLHNIYVQLVKTAFKNFYDILDKIACFINDYLELGIPNRWINFRSVWYTRNEEIRKKVRDTRNLSLNALFDLYRDFREGPYEALRKTRDALTHRFVNIRDFQEIENEENMTEETLVQQTLTLARAVRNALIYLLQFVYTEECKKEAEIDGDVLPLFASNFPDNLKSRR